MTEYRQAIEGEEPEIIDFANMVFSMASQPTDFCKFYPAVYGVGGFANLHMIAAKEEKIVATVAVKPMNLKLSENDSLFCGYLGTVSTHPYEQGKGHMRQLMNLALKRSLWEGMDFIALAGQRQRYNHYDFENCSSMICYSVYSDNLKTVKVENQCTFMPLDQLAPSELDVVYAAYQKLFMTGQRSRELFSAYLHTGKADSFAVLQDKQVKGYLYVLGNDIHEFYIDEPLNIQEVLYQWLTFRACHLCQIQVQLNRKEMIQQLGSIAESFSLSDSMMVHVFKWQPVLEKLMRFKSQCERLEDGEAVIEIKDEVRLKISVFSNQVTVEPSLKPTDVLLTHREAVTRFLSYQGQLQPLEHRLYSWFPLMLSIPAPDCF